MCTGASKYVPLSVWDLMNLPIYVVGEMEKALFSTFVYMPFSQLGSSVRTKIAALEWHLEHKSSQLPTEGESALLVKRSILVARVPRC